MAALRPPLGRSIDLSAIPKLAIHSVCGRRQIGANHRANYGITTTATSLFGAPPVPQALALVSTTPTGNGARRELT